ncbi:MAG: beta strand repeat-containing protein [Candidatus Acidiferrales bacterium]
MHAILWSVLAATWLAAAAPGALAQGSRKDDIIFGPSGHPVAGATVRVCQPAATGTPCLPLATIYTDATLTVPSANPFQADGIGNYHFYAPAGRYEIQISSPQISGTITQPDVILPPDLSTSGAGNNISAFGLTLGGNLSVAGNTTISGTLTTANFNPGAFTPSSLSVTGPGCMAGPRPSLDVTCPPYNAVGDAGILNGQNGSITAGTNTFTVSTTPVSGWHTGMGISINGAGASGASLVAKVGAITGNTFTLVDNSGNPMNAGTTISGTGFKDDDTLAIQAALAAACATPTTSGGRDVFFPPANYAFTVAQNTTAATFTTCQDLYLHGANAASHNGVQFGRAPTSVLLAQSGSIPGSGPTIDASYPNGNEVTVANLTITGYNTAFYSQGAPDITLDNDNFSVNKTGLSGNAGVHLSNLYWARILGGSIQTGGSTHPYPPALLLSGDACSGCTATVINFRMQDTRLVGGNIQYVQTTPENASQPGYWEIDNADTENQDSDYLSIINSSGSAFTFGPIKISRASVSDASTTTGAIINFHGAFSTDVLSGVTIDHSTPADDNFSGAAVIMSPGTLTGYQAIGCGEGIACATLAEDSSGKIVGTGYVTNQQGIDYFSNTSDNRRLTTNPFFNGGAADGPSIRATQNGNPFASYGLDALNGFMFSTGAASGWMSQLQASSAGNIDVAFAQTYPPTGLTGTPSSTGGTLAAGTYYIYGASDTIAGDNCNTQSALSAASNIAGPFVLTGSTSSIALSWTPAAAGLTQINGYCFLVNSSNVESPFAVRINSTGFVSGASSNSVTVTTTNASTGVFPVSQMAAAHHITPAGSVWNGDSTPLASAAPPYIPACLAGTTCSGSLALSPVVADSFVRANASTLGANWTVLGGVSPLAISSNSASVSGGSYGEESWNGQMFAPDQWSRAKINTLDGNGAGVMVRAAGAGTDTAYLYFCSTTSARSITKRIAGTSTTLATAGSACSVGDTLELDVAGTTLIGIHNGSVDLTATDSSIASGAPGISVFTSGNSLVSWIGGNLPAGNGAQSLFNQPNTWPAAQTFAALGTASNCNSSASPAACGPAIAGSVAVPTGTTPTLVVDTSGVTANSQIFLTPDESLGAKLGVTCNNALATVATPPIVTARTPGTSFTVQINATVNTNPVCLNFLVVN